MLHSLELLRPGVIVVAVLTLSILAVTLLVTIQRGRQIPRCYQCGAHKVRPSRPVGIVESAAQVLLIRCYRCGGCLTRFHALRSFDPPGPQSIS